MLSIASNMLLLIPHNTAIFLHKHHNNYYLQMIYKLLLIYFSDFFKPI